MDYNFLGYRFRPTEEEIITYFLERKMRGLPIQAVNEVGITQLEPWELPDKAAVPDDEEWYFFSAPKKYGNSVRTERTTKGGFWKVTGKDRAIRDDRQKEVIGLKKNLVYYYGRGRNALKTSWVIHEYHSKNASAFQEPYVLCRLKGNLDDKPENFAPGESSRHAASHIVK